MLGTEPRVAAVLWGNGAEPAKATARQRAKNPDCCFKMILKRALNADTLDPGVCS